MHGVRQLDPTTAAGRYPGGGAAGCNKDGLPSEAVSDAILRGAGIRRRDIITHALPSGQMEIAGGGPP